MSNGVQLTAPAPDGMDGTQTRVGRRPLQQPLQWPLPPWMYTFVYRRLQRAADRIFIHV